MGGSGGSLGCSWRLEGFVLLDDCGEVVLLLVGFYGGAWAGDGWGAWQLEVAEHAGCGEDLGGGIRDCRSVES